MGPGGAEAPAVGVWEGLSPLDGLSEDAKWAAHRLWAIGMAIETICRAMARNPEMYGRRVVWGSPDSGRGERSAKPLAAKPAAAATASDVHG